MVALSTPSRVRNKIHVEVTDISDAALTELIEDAQAYIEAEAERTFAATDSDYNLARGACTDLAAAYALIAMLGGSYSGLQFNEADINISAQQSSKLSLIKELLIRVNKVTNILKPKSSALRPKSSTFY